MSTSSQLLPNHVTSSVSAPDSITYGYILFPGGKTGPHQRYVYRLWNVISME